jgi:hypothetical protein
MENNKRIPLIKYRISKVDIQDFVNDLHNIQLEMIERAVEKSNYKDAIELIDYIKAKN